MKINLPLRLATLATVTFSSFIPFNTPVKAAGFEEQAIDQEGVIAIARPYGQNKYDLLVIEQIPGKQACWAENGSNPVLVDPLLLNFDFTGICRRATDSNGYSIRVDGTDLGLDYLLRLVPRNGELVLVGTPRVGSYSEIVLGSTKGLASGFMKIILNPGWQFSKRAYQGKALGHFYISGSKAAIAGDVAATPSNPSVTLNPDTNTTTTAGLKDISNNPYKTEIEKAVALGIVSGFEDNTFRPQDSVTREQFVSMAVDAIATVYKVDLATQPQRDMIPFKDVESSRWSANKIKWAQWNFLNVGNPNNTFQPTESITRAELIDTARRMAIHLKNQLDLPREIQQTQEPAKFSDISGSWAQTVITEMSGYCGVATPINETGTEFAPDRKATRDYTTAVLKRIVECVKSEAQQANNKTNQ
ncbi:S-layer domain protein [Rippkaea orientalis PCC 8801]|uniref:S-layer domain protein n=1 Tax=Rippkaea orientalis (strain PCC 8801 / RF-1) TaxID=41431 RepID=B7K5U8_RIPO1|nr:DUF3747 domain-containing protein [Rippkaea orientalis]ACK68001.1 S-layer domain protein [Rippkaea orientalis PCC 8801]